MLKKTLISLLVLASSAPAFANDFKVTSPDIAEGAQLNKAHVFQGFGCEGDNKAPVLNWSGAPEGTKSFAITAYDPDAPTGSGWWHWFAFNIPADTKSNKDGLPSGSIELKNDYGAIGFGGACPPPGEVHRYIFTVHALPVELEIDGSVSNALAGFMVNANATAKASITAVYNR